MINPHIDAIASRLEPRLARSFLQAMAAIQREIDQEALAAALRNGNVTAIRRALASINVPAALKDAVRVVSQVFAEAWILTMATVPPSIAPLSFRIVNPLATAAAKANAARMVTAVSAETKAGIRALIARSFADALPPVKTARIIRGMVGITSRQAQAVLNARAGWAKAGLSADVIEGKATRYAAKLLRQRALNIARTESIRAASEGQLAAWQQAAKDGRIQPHRTRRIWVAARGERTCEVCKRLHGQSVAFDAPFVLGDLELMASPAHPSCRCSQALRFTS